MNPKAIRAEEMFGETNKASGEWVDGVFAAMWSKFNDRNRKDMQVMCRSTANKIKSLEGTCSNMIRTYNCGSSLPSRTSNDHTEVNKVKTQRNQQIIYNNTTHNNNQAIAVHAGGAI